MPCSIKKACTYVYLIFILSGVVIADNSTNIRFALVIGNSDYNNISHLKNAVNDANLMSKTLESLGFKVNLLTNADREQMVDAVDQFGEMLAVKQRGEALLFFYSGHGLQNKGESLLLPIDYDPNSDWPGVTLQDIISEFNIGSYDTKIIIVDACRTDDKVIGDPLTFSDSFSIPSGTFLAFSTSSSEPAVDGSEQNSPYTEALTTAMQTTGLDLTDIFNSTRKQVSKETNHQQVPQEINKLNEKFFFNKSSKPSNSVNFASREQAEWKKIHNSNNAEDYFAFLEQFPNGEFSALARQRYDKFLAHTDHSPQHKSRYGINLIYLESPNKQMMLKVVDVESSSIFSGKLFSHDIILQINHTSLPEGNPNKILGKVFDSKKRLDLLVKRGIGLYNISIKK